MCVFDAVCKLTVFTKSKMHILGFSKESILENFRGIIRMHAEFDIPLAILTSSFRITRKTLALCFLCPEHILDNLHAAIMPFR
ncbi:hypothetical protein FF2_042802 [Malus domestica]